MSKHSTAEHERLRENAARERNWQRWGPYLAERQWATVREDYSADGDPWAYFPHDHARSRAYRWGEDGLLGWCDRQCRLCFGLALWNGKDAILKERMFGLTGPEGNHGEDVKEVYDYLDATPTHSYSKAMYRYPQAAFPYDELVGVNRERSREEPEYELTDTGIFDDHRFFDVTAEYAKASPHDMLIRITVKNWSDEPATLHLLPTVWYRNTWSWGEVVEDVEQKPTLKLEDDRLVCPHKTLGTHVFSIERRDDIEHAWLFTDNETNTQRLFGEGDGRRKKDAFHRYIIDGEGDAVFDEQQGTKAAALFKLDMPAGESITLHMRLTHEDETSGEPFGKGFADTFAQRIEDADAFYDAIESEQSMADEEEKRRIARRAFAGLLFSKQFYHLSVEHWLRGDTNQPPPPKGHRKHRNRDWTHLFNRDVLLMPDAWEYPWYAAWDLAFHAVAMAPVDAHFAKKQMMLLLREWYMHPNGSLPAYEFNFNDVNPPVHAWACWRIYKMTAPRGQRDVQFLERTFQKLLLNFTWWVNRKDPSGNHIFSGGFLGLDNIAVFDRSKPLPNGGMLQQADGTAWMAFYCGVMLSMALELAKHNRAYEDLASKFFEHYVHIIDAVNSLGGCGLWDDEDGFYYDQLQFDDHTERLRVRSLVGLIPLIAGEVIEQETLDELPAFTKRMKWFMEHRDDLARHVSYMCSVERGGHCHYLLAIPSEERLKRVLGYLLSEDEFLSPFGIRSLSKVHAEHPYVLDLDGEQREVRYEPGESTSDLFGGNSNWRGPIWMPTSYLIIEALRRYQHYFGDALTVECPAGSGQQATLGAVADQLSRRLVSIFLPDESGRRPWQGGDDRYANDPAWKDLMCFHEYFHGDSGKGLGAAHQTGWTSLVTQLMRNRRHD